MYFWIVGNPRITTERAFYGKISFTFSRTCLLRDGSRYLMVDSMSE